MVLAGVGTSAAIVTDTTSVSPFTVTSNLTVALLLSTLNVRPDPSAVLFATVAAYSPANPTEASLPCTSASRSASVFAVLLSSRLDASLFCAFVVQLSTASSNAFACAAVFTSGSSPPPTGVGSGVLTGVLLARTDTLIAIPYFLIKSCLVAAAAASPSFAAVAAVALSISVL